MLKKGFVILVVMVILILIATVAEAQNLEFTEFPIAVGRDSTFLGGGAFDGTNCLVGILGDTLDSRNITAQLISQAGSLIGSRISVGRKGIPPNEGAPAVAFDGINYLIVWMDAAGGIYGQFIAPSGNLIREPFPISTIADDDERPWIAFGDTTYLVVWIKNNALFGRLVDRAGNLAGTEIFISNSTRDPAIAFDGTNYLVSWVDEISETDITISGQLVSKQGILVGSNFTIDGSSYPSDNPISLCFDGSRYMVVFHEEINNEWDLFACFVTTSGTVAERIAITDESGNQQFPSIAFDGTNYLVTWTDGLWSYPTYFKGRFFNTSGIPVDTAFTIFGPSLDYKIPIYGGVGGGIGSEGYKYLALVTRCDTAFTNGDIYGAFISPYTGIDNKNSHSAPATFELMGNYPNPFNASTSIRYTLPENAHIEIAIYNIQGQLVRTLLNGEESSGTHIVVWDGRDNIGRNVSSGVYFFQLKTSMGIQEMRKMLLLR